MAPTEAPFVPPSGGTVRMAIPADPRSWDPIGTHFSAEHGTAQLVFAAAFGHYSDPPTTCGAGRVPRSIESWRWVDGTTAELVLRAGMQFHDKPPVNGREVVAEDLAYSIEKFAEKNRFKTALSELVEEVRVTGKYSVEIDLSEPFGSFFSDFVGDPADELFLLPREVAGDDLSIFEQNPESTWIGHGPYIFKEWQPGVKWVLERNPNFFIEGKPYIDVLEFIVVPDANTLEAKLRTGEIDLVISTGPSEPFVQKLENTDLNVIRCASSSEGNWNVIFMNSQGPPFDDVRVRMAVNLAIDREALKNLFMGGNGVNKGPLAPGVPYYLPLEELSEEAQNLLTYDPDRARQLLAEAGYPDGFDTQINYTGSYPFPATAFAEAEADMLTQVGIRTKLNLMERGRWLETVVQANYPVGEMGMSSGFLYGIESGMGLNGYYSNAGSVNRSMITDPDYDALYTKFRSSVDEAERETLAHQMQNMAVERAYRLFLFSNDRIVVHQPGLALPGCCPALGGAANHAMVIENMYWEEQ